MHVFNIWDIKVGLAGSGQIVDRRGQERSGSELGGKLLSVFCISVKTAHVCWGWAGLAGCADCKVRARGLGLMMSCMTLTHIPWSGPGPGCSADNTSLVIKTLSFVSTVSGRDISLVHPGQNILEPVFVYREMRWICF